MERFNQGVEFCSSAREVLHYLIREISTSYDKAVAGKMQENNRPIRMAKKIYQGSLQGSNYPGNRQ
uniref:hypothetical protein n=1 Tax=Clostridium sp. NkU-1 TaxID=1095009 RepID=UPI003261A141